MTSTLSVEVHREAVLLLSRRGGAQPDIAELVRKRAPLLPSHEAARVVEAVESAMRGLGPLEALFGDDSVTDVLINGPGTVWVERSGRIEATDLEVDEDEIALFIDRVVAPLGRRVDRSSPFVDARLPNGCRVHIVIPPIAVDGPCITIRRFRARPVELAEFGSAYVGDLREAVHERRNMLICGGTGAGKTTLLNALGAELPRDERIVTIEDAAELAIDLPHVVRLEARPPNTESFGEVTIRDLVRQALRMRPDRLILGEVRGGEAFDMLQAMNTGHSGSLTTCHANGPEEAMWRLAGLVQQAGFEQSRSSIRSQIRSAIDTIVHVSRGEDGRRVITEIFDVATSRVRRVEGT